MAIACLVDRAPCLPSRMCSIVSFTNSPACVLGDFPSRLSFRARSMVFFSGMLGPFPVALAIDCGLRWFVPRCPPEEEPQISCQLAARKGLLTLHRLALLS